LIFFGPTEDPATITAFSKNFSCKRQDDVLFTFEP